MTNRPCGKDCFNKNPTNIRIRKPKSKIDTILENQKLNLTEDFDTIIILNWNTNFDKFDCLLFK